MTHYHIVCLIQQLPEWLRVPALAICILLLIRPSKLERSFRIAMKTLMTVGSFLQKPLKDREKWPLGLRVINYFFGLQSYVMATCLFVMCLLVVMTWSINLGRLSLVNNFYFVGYIIALGYLSAVCKAEGDRGLSGK